MPGVTGVSVLDGIGDRLDHDAIGGDLDGSCQPG